MRLWSLHPRYLDARGLVALWREALLAQAVLKGQTRGYLHHPQLARFREQASPLGAIAAYLRAVHDEALQREYRFAGDKIGRTPAQDVLTVTRGQLQFEWEHLMAKLRTRDPARWAQWRAVQRPRTHPLFRVVAGGVAPWERASQAARPR